jgi:hypothetical protein
MLLAPFIVGVGSVFAKTDIVLTAADGKQMEAALKKTNEKLGATGTSVTIEKRPDAVGVTSTTMISVAGGKVTFNEEVYEAATEKSKKKAMKAFVSSMQDSGISAQGQQSVIDGMSSKSPDVKRMLIPLVMDSTSADLYTAMKWVNPFLPVIRLIFGIGAIVVSIMLIGSTIVDLCFIGLPIAREALNNKGEQSGGGGNKVPFVSADAVSVIKESESALDSSGGYKNAYLMYFKRRVLTYIIISICLLYLVVGELGGLISWLLSLGDGVVINQ